MATSRLSKEAEVKITNSLSEIAELVNSGANPNEAIAKTASANGIPVGHIELMVRAFNVGRSEAQRQSGAEPHEKLAEFELADPKSVMDIMYPSNIKSAAEFIKKSSISEVYSRAPISNNKNNLPVLPSLIKEAAKSIDAKTNNEGPSFRAVNSLIEKLGNASDRLRSESARDKDKIMDGIAKLAGYFRTFGAKPFVVVKDNSQRLFGKKAESLLNILESSNRYLKKQAGTVKDIMSPVSVDEEPYKSIKNCMDLANLHLNKKASSEFLGSLAKYLLSESYKEHLPSYNSGSVLSGTLNKEAAFFSTTPGLTRAYSRLKRLPMDFVYKSRDYVAPKATDNDYGKDIEDYKFDADQLMQNQSIKNIRATGTLADLLSNDEVISAHHPEDVTFHFNEIAQAMPESLTNTAIMRPLLRKRLEGGAAAIDPYDVNMMLEMESLKKTRENPLFTPYSVRSFNRPSNRRPKA